MIKILLPLTLASAFLFTACSSLTEQEAATASVQATETVTDENYPLAETETIMAGYITKIAKATNTDGVGVFMNVREGADPKDRTIPRINFDTIYSWAVVDLTEPVTLVMPETNGRYQTAWIVSQEHYNPMAFDKPGSYVITQKDVGSRYSVFVLRTQANTQDASDMAVAHKLQDGLKLLQKDKGSFTSTYQWDSEEVVKMRHKWQGIAKKEEMNPDTFFGKKGERSDKEHNAGTAIGWGGFTTDQAAYINYYSTTAKPQMLTLKDVPAKAFWSVTVYDQGGFVISDNYNINSQFAKKNADGSVTIHFGGDVKADNYVDTFEDMTFILRMYQPNELYLSGKWTSPELVLAQ